jgi:hypothetical protein
LLGSCHGKQKAGRCAKTIEESLQIYGAHNNDGKGKGRARGPMIDYIIHHPIILPYRIIPSPQTVSFIIQINISSAMPKKKCHNTLHVFPDTSQGADDTESQNYRQLKCTICHHKVILCQWCTYRVDLDTIKRSNRGENTYYERHFARMHRSNETSDKSDAGRHAKHQCVNNTGEDRANSVDAFEPACDVTPTFEPNCNEMTNTHDEPDCDDNMPTFEPDCNEMTETHVTVSDNNNSEDEDSEDEDSPEVVHDCDKIERWEYPCNEEIEISLESSFGGELFGRERYDLNTFADLFDEDENECNRSITNRALHCSKNALYFF